MINPSNLFKLSIDLFLGGMGPFWTGAICSNLAWLTIWPIDVVKSQIQSGKEEYRNKSVLLLLYNNIQSGILFRGILPGLLRSFIANGCSMVVYNKVLELMKTYK